MNFLSKLKSFTILIAYYFKDILFSAIRIGYDVVTPMQHSSPGVFEFPLKAQSDFEVYCLCNLITFSPGTMVIGYDEKKRTLLIHAMFLEDPAEAIASIKEHLESKLLEVLR